MNRKKKLLIDKIPTWIYDRKDLLNNSGEFCGPWGHRLNVMPVEMRLQLKQKQLERYILGLVKAYKYFQKRKILSAESILPACNH